MKLHLKQSVEAMNNLSLILRGYSIYSVSLDALDVAVEQLDHPLKCDELGTEVLGSCHGLVLLYNGKRDVCVWYPSTKKQHKLPFTETLGPHSFIIPQSVNYGIGYDPVSDDYKVVRMIQFYGNSDDTLHYHLCYKGCWGKFANGALHWVVSRKYEEVDPDCLIAAFDLASDEYRLVPIPDFGDKTFHMNVEVLGGCLCLLCNYTDHHVDYGVKESWTKLTTMKDYGVKESWTKLFSVEQPKHISSFQYVVPLAYSKNGSQVLLLQDNKKLLWLDLDRNVVKEINVHGLPDYFEAEVCVQSLVPLSGVGSAIKKKKKKQRRGEK